MAVGRYSPANPATSFQPDEVFARQLDADDPLRGYRDRFLIPCRPDGRPVVYFAGNSLGLQPKSVRPLLNQELQDWADLGVDAHFSGKTPWYSYHEVFRESGARLVGAKPGEVVMMNSLTVNLHLMMVSFYRPTPTRFQILIEDPCFPSDLYAVKSQLRYHGCDPTEALVTAKPRYGEHLLRIDDIDEILAKEGDRIALVMLGGVNFVTGQVLDMAHITAAAKSRGCIVGFDLAHAAGNIPLRLHDWDVDFAVWCNYKYLNSGPGAVGGCFVHERHGETSDFPRFGGWWGNDPATRFQMHLKPDFVPREGADGWQISNPPILSMAPVRASLAIFGETGMLALRTKSERLTRYLEFLLDRVGSTRFVIITPRDPAQRGCQLSLLVRERAKVVLEQLHADGVICDFREPNVLRVAPTPLYNTFHDVWVFADLLARLLKAG